MRFDSDSTNSFIRLRKNRVQYICIHITLLNYLFQRRFCLLLSRVHIIGHGVGAHIAGYVGKSIPNIGRITGNHFYSSSIKYDCQVISIQLLFLGLDPTGPKFECLPHCGRLQASDAFYVDVIHTDGEGFTHYFIVGIIINNSMNFFRKIQTGNVGAFRQCRLLYE